MRAGAVKGGEGRWRRGVGEEEEEQEDSVEEGGRGGGERVGG